MKFVKWQFMKMPPTFNKNSEIINAIIETPKGSSIKYTFEPETELFKVSKILPQGLAFPMHFGFIPHTKGDDGDPLDVLILMDEPCYPGCHLECKVIGVIEAEQTEKDRTDRNDRIIAKAIESERHEKVNTIKDLDSKMVDQVIAFFVSYNKLSNKVFTPLRKGGPAKAVKLIKNGIYAGDNS